MRNKQQKLLKSSILFAICTLTLTYSNVFAGGKDNKSFLSTNVLTSQNNNNGWLSSIEIPESLFLTSDANHQTSMFSGGFSYDYSLFAPAGTNNLTPSLGLNYNSSSAGDRASRVGLGWELSETYVERITEHTPNNLTDDTFRLVLNGQSYDLIWNPNTGRFHTQHETFLNIKKLTGGNNFQGDYWQVIDPSGITYRLGFKTNTELNCSTRNYISRWYVDQINDTSGNHIYYTYQQSPHPQDLGVAYLDEIKYNNDQSRIIDFVYEDNDRPDQPISFNEGCRTRYSRRLSQIKILVQDQLIRQYDFSFTTNGVSQKSLLSSITESDGAGNSLPPTTFDYYPEVQGWDDTPSMWLHNGPKLEDTHTTMGDVNGDGYVDIITEYDAKWRVYLNSGNNSWSSSEQIWLSHNSPNMEDPKVRVMDVTGDGKPEIVTRFTGEGWRVYINEGNRWNSNYQIWFNRGPDLNDDHVRFGDPNGDGLTDIIQESDTKWKVFINTGNSWVDGGQWADLDFELSDYIGPVYIPRHDIFEDQPIRDGRVMVIDVNGDGMSDIVRRKSSEDWRVYLSTGSSWLSTPDVWHDDGPFLSDNNVTLGDVNGDGLPDIVEEKSRDWKIYPNTGSAWGDPVIWLADGPNLDQPDIMLADADGNGTLDLINRESDWFVYLSNAHHTELLSKIETSLGGTVSIDYTPSTHFDNTGADSISDLISPMSLVTKVTEDNGASGAHNTVRTTTYAYKNGFYDHTTPLFRGFAEVIETDVASGITTKHQYHQDKARLGREFRTEVRDQNGNLFQVVANSFSYVTTNWIHDTILEQVDIYTHDGVENNPKQTTISYQYDSYNQASRTSYSGDVDVLGDERFEYTEYVYNTVDWIINRPKHTSLRTSDDTTILRESWFFYDGAEDFNLAPTNGLMTKQENWLDGGVNPIIQYEYDSFGNRTKETDANGNVTQYVYGISDTSYTYADQIINANNQTTTFSYDLGTGSVLSATDPNGFVTTSEYDGFGRIIKEIKPYNSSDFPSMSYLYDIDGSFPESVKTSQRTNSGQGNTLDSYSILDGFGRVLQTRIPAEDVNQQIINDTFYDQFGRVQEQSVPYFGPFSSTYSTPLSSAKSTQVEYDTLGREVKIINPDDTTRTISYDHWHISYLDENSHLTEHFLDAYQQIIEIKEYNSGETYSTEYVYNAADELVSITDHFGNIISWIYDSLGRQKEINDPNIGKIIYAYDEGGNQISETDSRGITLLTSYDSLNRMIKVDYPTQVDTVYTYDSPIIGTISTISDATGTVTYTYDQRLRQIKEVRTMDGISWTTETAFDAADRVIEVTYPTSEALDLTYNAQGQVESVGDLILNYDYDATNRITSKSFVNGIVTHIVYALDHFRLIAIQTLGLQDLGYEYDNVGNITSITDQLEGLGETFVYDDLDRLITAKKTIGYSHHYFYDAIGNVTRVETDEKESDYTYGENAGPHAVTSLDTLIIEPPVSQGDVSCDSSVNTVDALFILQFNVGIRNSTPECPLPDSTQHVYTESCDVNDDESCNTVDALFILQCNVGVSNQFCSTPND